MADTSKANSSKKFTPMGLVFALLGCLLFSYFVWKAGIGDILNGIERLGAGFLIIVAISGIRKVVRALAWYQCFESTGDLRFREALAAVIAADALGTVMPLGMMVSEPAKAALVREKAPFMTGLSAIAIENLFYSLSVAVFIFCGMAVMLYTFPLPQPIRIASVAALVCVVAFLAVGFVGIRKQWKILSGLVEFLYQRGIGVKLLGPRRERVRMLEDRIYGFYVRHQSRFLLIIFFEACFHMAGVLEAYVTLAFISGPSSASLLAAFILESVNRIITVVFKFIPLRMGVDEWGSGSVTRLLNLGTPSGVTLAVVRKGRDLAWTAIGVALLVQRGLTPAKIAMQSEIAMSVEKAGARG